MGAPVFISYARRDGRAAALNVSSWLRRNGIEPWLDQEAIAGGASWSREIEQALEQATVVIAILTRGAVESDICRAEQITALDAGKRVIPVLAEPGAAVPVYLKALQYRDLSDGADHSATFALLLEDIRGALPRQAPPKPRTTRLAAPALPPHFIERPELTADFRKQLLSESPEHQVGITALAGMGGIGKTVLATAVCHDPIVQAAYPDGIYWVTAGQNTADLLTPLQTLGGMLGLSRQYFDTIERGRLELRTHLAGRAALIVIDDVWDARQVEPFRGLSPTARLLFTTRDRSIVIAVGGYEFALDVLTEDQAYALLAEWSGVPVESLPVDAIAIVRECGRLPLAISMVGALVRANPKSWPHVLHRLKTADLSKLLQHYPNYQYTTLAAAIQVSVDALPPEGRAAYLQLAAVPDDFPIPPAALEIIWQMDSFDVEDTIRILVSRSLANRTQQGSMLLHDLQLDYLRHIAGKDALRALHSSVADRYQAAAGGIPQSGPDDGYYHRHYPWHLAQSGRTAELSDLLFHFGWLEAKLRHTDVGSLIADFDPVINNDALNTLRRTLRLSANVIGRDAAQFPSQLIGRLRDSDPPLKNLIEGAANWRESPWLEPLTASLVRPGGVLVGVLSGHSGGIDYVGVLPGGRRAVSAASDDTIRIWDIESRTQLRVIGMPSKVWERAKLKALALSPDGQRLLCGQKDKLLLFNVETGDLVWEAQAGGEEIRSAALIGIGKRAVSATARAVELWDVTGPKKLAEFRPSWDADLVAAASDGRHIIWAGGGKLQAWSLETWMEVRTVELAGLVLSLCSIPQNSLVAAGTYEGQISTWNWTSDDPARLIARQDSAVRSIDVEPHQSIAVTTADDERIRVWNLKNDTLLRTMAGHSDGSYSAAFIGRSRLVVSGGGDHVLKIWDLDGADEHAPSERRYPVHCIAVAADGRRVVSANATGLFSFWDGLSGAPLRSTSIQDLTGAMEPPVNLQWIRVAPSGDVAICFYQHSDSHTQHGFLCLDLSHKQLIHRFGAETAVLADMDWAHIDWDQGCVYFEDDAGAFAAVDFRTGKRLHSFPAHSIPWAVVVDGDRVYTAMGILRIRDLSSGRLLQESPNIDDMISTLAPAKAQRRVYCAGAGGDVHVWDCAAERWIRSMRLHASQIRQVLIFPDGLSGVSASEDRTLKVWETDSGNVLAEFAADAPLRCCAIAPASGQIMCGDAEGEVHFLKLHQ